MKHTLAKWVKLAVLASCPVAVLAAPVELQPYPRALVQRPYDNPLEQGTLPISVPDRVSANARASAYTLPYEGAVATRQYRHQTDDSPLLIVRHYAGQLKAQGFELLTVCESPCRSASGLEDAAVYWKLLLDLANRLEMRPFGDRGTYLLGYRPGAVVAVRVGQWDAFYGSTVKSIEAASLDLAPIERYIAAQQAVVTPSRLPAPPAPPRSDVPLVAASDAAELVRQSKGYLVLQLSSFDPKCGYCVRSNPEFDRLAAAAAPPGTKFARVAYQPWPKVAEDAFATSYGVRGLPAFFTFKDGQLVRTREGSADAAELKRLLVDGLN